MRTSLIGIALFLTACQSQLPAPTALRPTASPNFATVTAVALVMPTLPPTALDPGQVFPRTTPNLSVLPKLVAYQARITEALKLPIPILLLDHGLSEEQRRAQEIAIRDDRLQQNLRDPRTNAPLRNEVFGIYPLRDSDITSATAGCRQNPCYRVELYNFALNFYTAAVVDIKANAVITVIEFPNIQPDIPADLTAVAVEIATQSSDVKNTLGYSPETQTAVMANTKTALNGTRCERSEHLCVAPTFVVGERALWAIVDLTDARLVGVRWTQVGVTGPAITEKTLQNDVIMRTYCQKNTALSRDGWSLNYTLTSSDGLRISEVFFNGKPIFDSVKLVDWHVNYSSQDAFGYSDAVGCPVFSQAAVIAVEPPQLEPLMEGKNVVGFVLEQEFWSELWPRPCNYYYEQKYEFYLDGRFRPVVSSVGRGCGNDGTYRPVTRIAMSSRSRLSEWDSQNWKIWSNEDWRLQSALHFDASGHYLRLTDATGQGFYLDPAHGQFGDGGRGDNAYIYATLHNSGEDEGDSDMPTIGPCCNMDFRQGPEKFINNPPQVLDSDSQLVIWYVAQLKNDDRPGNFYCWAESILENGVFVPKEYPCPSGPLFTPIRNP